MSTELLEVRSLPRAFAARFPFSARVDPQKDKKNLGFLYSGIKTLSADSCSFFLISLSPGSHVDMFSVNFWEWDR
jgi:hypothetical protein